MHIPACGLIVLFGLAALFVSGVAYWSGRVGFVLAIGVVLIMTAVLFSGREPIGRVTACHTHSTVASLMTPHNSCVFANSGGGALAPLFLLWLLGGELVGFIYGKI